jgi:hypothetical protein
VPRGYKIRLDGKPHRSPFPWKDLEDVTIDMSNWREQVRNLSRIKLDDEQKSIFLEIFSKTNRKTFAAAMAGVTWQCVKNHIDRDPEFAECFEEARNQYADMVERVAREVGQEGIYEPILGGRFKDEVVAHKRVVATNILAMQMKRSNPEYREKAELDLNHKGGVLVVPAKMSVEDWVSQFGSPEAQDDAAGG